MIRRFTAAAAALSMLGLAACATTPGPMMSGPGPARFAAEDFAWSARGGQNSVQGRVAYRADGKAFDCIGSVGLTPDTPYTRARFQTLYGSTDRAAVPVAVVRARDVADPNADYRNFVRSATCAGNAFSFSGLPDGSWFVIVPVRAQGGEPIVLMQRVQTRGGRIANLTL
ncbi:hypothetical protein ASG17_03190 [Brevundimonas sp. Leaf363]|uniref:hypothetical protein n=1 Tax=Brevundimonas sp. Leaf363 TaxID=1736353 RepID=UPI0006F8A6AF|nr:hypothetical protein [Brevundimonas sp. Leaf363]KQS55118.1 hypothetical protein ASG17_03190 [Brevundimonas sp. Leaf363]